WRNDEVGWGTAPSASAGQVTPIHDLRALPVHGTAPAWVASFGFWEPGLAVLSVVRFSESSCRLRRCATSTFGTLERTRSIRTSSGTQWRKPRGASTGTALGLKRA